MSGKYYTRCGMALLGLVVLLGAATIASAQECQIGVDVPPGAIVYQGTSREVLLQVRTTGPCSGRVNAEVETSDPGLTWSFPLPAVFPAGRTTPVTAKLTAASDAAPGGHTVQIRFDFLQMVEGIERPAGSQTASIFVYVVPQAGPSAGPEITGYAATNPRGVRIDSAPPGAPLLIEGSNLGTGGTIRFNGIPAPVMTWSPTEILVTVPQATSYPSQGPVTAIVDGQTATGPEFTITPPADGPQTQPARPSDPDLNQAVTQLEQSTQKLTEQYRQDLATLAAMGQEEGSLDRFYQSLSDKTAAVSDQMEAAVQKTVDRLLNIESHYPPGTLDAGLPDDVKRALVLVQQAIDTADRGLANAAAELQGVQIGGQKVEIAVLVVDRRPNLDKLLAKGSIVINVPDEDGDYPAEPIVRILWAAWMRISDAPNGRVSVGGVGEPGDPIRVTVAPGAAGGTVVGANGSWKVRFNPVAGPVNVTLIATDGFDGDLKSFELN